MFTIETHDFPFINRTITVRVAFPRVGEGTLPYMIVQDAQNFFDVWDGHETKTYALSKLEDLILRKVIPPMVLVGIDTWQDSSYCDRFTDFSPWVSSDLFTYIPSWDVRVSQAGGRGDAYADFVVKELVPFLEEKYNIGKSPQMRGIGGSSMAAMISIYTASKYPDVFGKIGLMSPALWCFKKEFSKYLPTISNFPSKTKIYMDIGRKESSDPKYKNFPQEYLEGAIFIHDILRQKCPNIQFMIDEDGEHNMPSISKHIPMMMTYLWS